MNHHPNPVHAISFAMGIPGSLVIWDESHDQHADNGGRTYVFLSKPAGETWHGYVTPETLAVLHHVAGEVVL